MSQAPSTASSTFNIGGDFANNGSFAVGGGSGALTLAFNGSLAQHVTGTAFDATNVTINNSAGVIFSTGVGISRTLALVSGTLTNGSNLTLYSGGFTSIARTAGTLGSLPTIQSTINVTYLGNVTTDIELPTGSTKLSDLTINTSGTVTLNADATVNGTLTLTQGNLATGSHTLTLASNNDMVGEGAGQYVVGNLTVTKSVTTGSSALGGIGVSLASGADNIGSVTVTRVSGSGGAVTVNTKTGINRKWTISSGGAPTSGRTMTTAKTRCMRVCGRAPIVVQHGVL
jgi:fibronectin-binding autotransporter adhesin